VKSSLAGTLPKNPLHELGLEPGGHHYVNIEPLSPWVYLRHCPIQFRDRPVGVNQTRSRHTDHTLLLGSTMGKRKRTYNYTSFNDGIIPVTHVQPPTTFSPPLAMQQSVWDSVVGGNFVDAKIFAFSRHSREPGRVDTPKALFVNTHVLATACSYFRSRTPFLIF